MPTNTDGRKIVRARYGESAVLQCEAFGNPPPLIEWWLVRPEKFIGSYEPIRKQIQMSWSRNDSYRIILGGNLIIQNSNRGLVERYRCIASNEAVIFFVFLKNILKAYYIGNSFKDLCCWSYWGF